MKLTTMADRKRSDSQCCKIASCGEQCVSLEIPHTIHTCGNPRCYDCHDGKVHVDAMLARRRTAARLREAAEMEGLDGPEFEQAAVEALEY